MTKLSFGINQPTWGHVVWLETSLSVSKHPSPNKPNECSCRCGYLGLQVARRRGGFTGLEAALQFAGSFGLAERLRLFGAIPIPSHHLRVYFRYLQSQAHISLSHVVVPCHVRISEPAELQSWGHVGSIETSSSVSKHKSNESCRWGYVGLQVARRRGGFTGLEAALQFAGFFGLAERLRLFGAMLIPSLSCAALCNGKLALA
ncbi:unnamed protein product [Effrenium voratum]|uniref:Uncharacterized protein n=1 Tax=Effrenium voratum TaxID=2562239 RepID=A0AA36NGH7_9DINO|nr:unnamed protein product [Effrenium voratum]CAJ1446351.1 unnamed protein product [Effrenium voratum]